MVLTKLYRYTMLPALSLNGIMALDVYTESLTAEKFNEFIEHLLDCMNQFLMPDSVLIMDNASIHHSADLQRLVEAR